MREISLNIDNTIVALAGDPYGKKIALEQVAPILENNLEKVRVIIPSHIKNVSISFIQGFTKGLSNVIQEYNFFDLIEIEANEKVKKRFYDNI